MFSLQEMGSEHQLLLFHKSVLWVSRGKVLARPFEPRDEISQFVLSKNNYHLHKHLEDDRWIAKLACMPGIFEHLNELNIKMQSKNENIPTCSDKLKGFRLKIALWKTELTRGSLEMFPRSNPNRTIDKEFVLNLPTRTFDFVT